MDQKLPLDASAPLSESVPLSKSAPRHGGSVTLPKGATPDDIDNALRGHARAPEKPDASDEPKHEEDK